MHFDSERRNDVIDLMDYSDISDVSCVGKEVLLHFTSPLALHRTIKALSGHSILYINPVWMCSGGWLQVEEYYTNKTIFSASHSTSYTFSCSTHLSGTNRYMHVHFHGTHQSA
jgi:hypothetical protein